MKFEILLCNTCTFFSGFNITLLKEIFVGNKRLVGFPIQKKSPNYLPEILLTFIRSLVRTFSHNGCNRNCTAIDLSTQTKFFIIRQGPGKNIIILHQIHCLLPNNQLLKIMPSHPTTFLSFHILSCFNKSSLHSY